MVPIFITCITAIILYLTLSTLHARGSVIYGNALRKHHLTKVRSR